MRRRDEMPVYLFTGFLEAGKTTFIQETLEDKTFNQGEKTMVLLLEEGEVELDPSKFPYNNVEIVTLDVEEELTTEYLEKLEEEHDFERIVVEYNGMWLLDNLYNALPSTWTVYQEMCFFNAKTILTYNKNMRNLVVDKMKSPESIIFKQFDESMDKMELHKMVRVINRRCNIVYEIAKDKVIFDDIEDPLPFDINQDFIEVEDKDYAIWYQDINENEDKYYGKTIKFKGRTLLGGGLHRNEFVIGRHIMTCCVEDITFGGLVAKWEGSSTLEHGGWAIMTAKICKEYNHLYESEGPVFDVSDLEICEQPEEEVATFY